MNEALAHFLGIDKDTAEAIILITFGVIGIRVDILLSHIGHALDNIIVLLAPKIKSPVIHDHQHSVMMAHPINPERE